MAGTDKMAAAPDQKLLKKLSALKDSAEWDYVNALIESIYEGPNQSPPWTDALQHLKAALQAEHVTLMLRPPTADSAGVMINTGETTTEATKTYETEFYSLDPFVRLKEGEVSSAEELIGRQWLDSEVYKGYLEPLGIRHLLGADLYTRDGIECRFRVTRTSQGKAFSEEDKTLCRIVLPHLKRSIQLHARLDSLETERSLFAGTVNRMLLGVISYSETEQILEMNQEAKRILAEKDGIWLSGDTLTVDSAQESRDLHKIFKQILSGELDDSGPGVVPAISISRPSGRAKIGVLMRAIPAGPWSESKNRPALAVFLRDPEGSGMQPSQELVRRLFGLTRMEARLALLLTDGLTLDEAAEEMNVRRNTARTHLRSIFSKTGVTRQTMLVRLMLNSVMTLG